MEPKLAGFPLDMLCEIFESLNLEEVVVAGYVNRNWRDASEEALKGRLARSDNPDTIRKKMFRAASRYRLAPTQWIQNLSGWSTAKKLFDFAEKEDSDSWLRRYTLPRLADYKRLVQERLADCDSLLDIHADSLCNHMPYLTPDQLRRLLRELLSCRNEKFIEHKETARVLIEKWIEKAFDVTKISGLIGRYVATGDGAPQPPVFGEPSIPYTQKYAYFIWKCGSVTYADDLVSALGLRKSPEKLLWTEQDIVSYDARMKDDLLAAISPEEKPDMFAWAIQLLWHTVLTKRALTYRANLLRVWIIENQYNTQAVVRLRTNPAFTVDYDFLLKGLSEYSSDEQSDAATYLYQFTQTAPEDWKTVGGFIDYYMYWSLMKDGARGVETLQKLKAYGVKMPSILRLADLLDLATTDVTCDLPGPEVFLRMLRDLVGDGYYPDRRIVGKFVRRLKNEHPETSYVVEDKFKELEIEWDDAYSESDSD